MLKKNHILIYLLSLGFLGILLASPLITALPGGTGSNNYTIFQETDENESDDDSDGDHVDDDYEEANEREIHIEAQEHQIQVESTLKNGENKNKFELQIQAESEGLKIQAEFKQEVSDSESALKFKVQLYKLIEFVDSNADGMLSPLVDEVKQEKMLNNFAPAVYTSENTSSGNTLHKIDIVTTDGVFAAHFFIMEDFQIINATTVTPNQIKFNIEISNFPYMDSESLLALYTKLETESEYEYEEDTEDEVQGYAENESEIKTTVNGVTGVFSWAKTADVDGITKNVTTSPVEQDDEDETQDKMYITYPQGTSIYHDPKIGIAGLLTEPINTTSPNLIPGFPTMVVVSLLVLSTIAIVKKYRRL